MMKLSMGIGPRAGVGVGDAVLGGDGEYDVVAGLEGHISPLEDVLGLERWPSHLLLTRRSTPSRLAVVTVTLRGRVRSLLILAGDAEARGLGRDFGGFEENAGGGVIGEGEVDWVGDEEVDVAIEAAEEGEVTGERSGVRVRALEERTVKTLSWPGISAPVTSKLKAP